MASKRSKYNHVFGDEQIKPEQMYGTLPQVYTSGESSFAAASRKFFAVPKKGPGGPVCICQL